MEIIPHQFSKGGIQMNIKQIAVFLVALFATVSAGANNSTQISTEESVAAINYALANVSENRRVFEFDPGSVHLKLTVENQIHGKPVPCYAVSSEVTSRTTGGLLRTGLWNFCEIGPGTWVSDTTKAYRLAVEPCREDKRGSDRNFNWGKVAEGAVDGAIKGKKRGSDRDAVVGAVAGGAKKGAREMSKAYPKRRTDVRCRARTEAVDW